MTHLDFWQFFQVIKAFIADAYATTSLPEAMAFRHLVKGRPQVIQENNMVISQSA